LLSLPPHQLSNFEFDDDELDLDPELDLHRSYNRPRLITVELDNDDVSDYVALRLAIAREKAMLAYREKWA
jgi:hypothetical protein